MVITKEDKLIIQKVKNKLLNIWREIWNSYSDPPGKEWLSFWKGHKNIKKIIMVPYVSYINLKSLWVNYSFLNVSSNVSRHIKFQTANQLRYKTKKIIWNKLLNRSFDIRIITQFKFFRRSTELEQRTYILFNLLTETILDIFFLVWMDLTDISWDFNLFN